MQGISVHRRNQLFAKSVVGMAITAFLLAACSASASGPNSDGQSDASPAATSRSGDDGGDDGADTATEPVRVSVITSLSGPLQPYGEQFLAAVHVGLAHATDGTNEAGGRAIEIAEVDDASDTETAVAAFNDEVGRGASIVTGSISSGIALAQAPLAEQNEVLYLSGPASTDAITGINDYTFRVGRQSYQDVMTVQAFVDDPSQSNVLVFAQDTAYGESNVAAVTNVIGTQGAEVDSILVPPGASDLTPFAAEAANASADVVLVAWVGTDTSAAMWQALDQQGVFDVSTVVSILDVAATYPVFYPEEIAPKIGFLGHYYPGITENAAAEALENGLLETDQPHDIYTNDGFIAGQMIARAVEMAGDDVAGMIEALEGWSFEAPKGAVSIRAEDHALLQPMYPTRMEVSEGAYEPNRVGELSAEDLAPPLDGS